MSSNADVRYVVRLPHNTKETVLRKNAGDRFRELMEQGDVVLSSTVVRSDANNQKTRLRLAQVLKWKTHDGKSFRALSLEPAIECGELTRQTNLTNRLGEFTAGEIIAALSCPALLPTRQDTDQKPERAGVADVELDCTVADAADELDDVDPEFEEYQSEEPTDGSAFPECPSEAEASGVEPSEHFGDQDTGEEPRWQELELRLRSLEETIMESTGDLQSRLESVQSQTADGTSTLARRIAGVMLIALVSCVLLGAIAVGSYLLIPTVRAEESGQPQVPVAGTPDLREDLRKVKAGVDDVRAEHHRSRELINRLLDMRLSEIIQDAAAKNSARNEELLAPLSARLDTLQKSVAGLPSAENVAAVDQRLKNLDAELKTLTGKEGELEQMQSALAELASQKSVSQIAAELKQISAAAEQLRERQRAVDDQLTLIAGSLKIPAATGLSNVIVLFDAGEAMGELDYKPAREALVTAVSESIRHTGERSLGVLWNRGDQRPIQLVNFASHAAEDARPHADRIRGEVISSGADHQWSVGLSDALERISTAPPNQPRRIVYITTPPERPEENVDQRLRQIVADARQVKAEIWILQLSGTETSPQIDLWQLAARTGGKFLLLNAAAGSPAKLRSQVAAELHQALSLPAPRGE